MGILLGTIAVGALTFAIIEGKPLGYASPTILACFAGAAVAVAALCAYELRNDDPMIDVRLFWSRSFSAVMLAATVTMFGFTGIALLTVMYLQHAQGVSALGAGVRALVMFVPFIVISPIAARLAHRFGFKLVLSVGLLVMAAGSFLLLLAVPERDVAHLWPGLLIVGVGSGLLIAPSTAAAIISVPPQRAGMAGSAVNMFHQLGNVLGASVLGTVLTTGFTTRLSDRLTAETLPADAVDRIVDAAENGSTDSQLPPAIEALVQRAATVAFTDAFHLGVVVAGIVIGVAAIPTLLWVRRRPEH